MADFLSDKNFIITGAASGMGLAIARLLRQRGAQVVLWDRDAAALQVIATELASSSSVVDVTQVDQITQALQAAVALFGGRLDGVIHAAGILHAGEFEAVALADHQRTIQVNLIGSLNVAYAVLPHLKLSQGSLLLFASVSAFYGAPEYTSYSAAKAAILSLAQALRMEYQEHGVHIGVVCPLFVSTPMLQGYNGATRLIRSQSPFFNTRTAEAVAPVVVAGLQRRQFMIFPGWRTRLLYLMSRYADALMYPISRITYQRTPR
jgi:3-dehydrosphinganine reductase